MGRMRLMTRAGTWVAALVCGIAPRTAPAGTVRTVAGVVHEGALRLEAGVVVVSPSAGGGDVRVPFDQVAEAVFDPAPPAPGAGTGLRGEYFAGMEFGQRLLLRVDPRIDVKWNKEPPHPWMPQTHYCVRWTGKIEPRFSETYVFETESDDGVRLWIDGRRVLENWTVHGLVSGKGKGATRTKPDRGEIPLVAGRRHDIRIEYFQGEGDAELRLYWSSPSQAREIVPADRLFLPGPWPEGVVTRAGSFLAGRIGPASEGGVTVARPEGELTLAHGAAARLVYADLSDALAAAVPAAAGGVLLANGDFVEGEVRGVEGRTVTVVSRLFGVRHYDGGADALAAVLADAGLPAPAWEVRAADGTVVHADAVRVDGDVVVADEPAAGPVRIPIARLAALRRH